MLWPKGLFLFSIDGLICPPTYPNEIRGQKVSRQVRKVAILWNRPFHHTLNSKLDGSSFARGQAVFQAVPSFRGHGHQERSAQRFLGHEIEAADLQIREWLF